MATFLITCERAEADLSILDAMKAGAYAFISAMVFRFEGLRLR